MKQNIDLLIETEKKLLSALMLKGGKAIPDAAEELTPDDFYRQEHKVIYKTLLELNNDNVPIDVLLVEQALNKSGDINKVTRQYLYGLHPLEFSTLRVPIYVKEIKSQSNLRRLSMLGRYITSAAENDSPLEEILNRAAQEMTTISHVKSRSVIPISEAAKDFWDELNRQEKGIHGLRTGLYNLDSIIGGLNKSDLIILAARPSMGKSALALNIAANVAKLNSVLFFSLEMSLKQLLTRLYSADSGVPSTKIQFKSYSDEETDLILSSCDHLAQLKLHLDDTAGLSLMAMKLRARRVKQKYGLDLIVVDYLQLMAGSGKYKDNRVQEVSELSRGLKALARELDIPIIALSQLSRAVELRADKRPMLSDLRESGSIEQDADLVMFLYREEYYDRDIDVDKRKDTELIIAKNRNGFTGTARLLFDKATQNFDDKTVKG